MHRYLRGDEVLRVIAHELVASKEWATAAALACCCKVFEVPVLDTLWEVQSRLLPLLESLPSDVLNSSWYTVSVCHQHTFFLTSTVWFERR